MIAVPIWIVVMTIVIGTAAGMSLICFAIWMDIRVNQLKAAMDEWVGHSLPVGTPVPMSELIEGGNDIDQHIQNVVEAQKIIDACKEPFQPVPPPIDMPGRITNLELEIAHLDLAIHQYGANASTDNLRRLVADVRLGYNLERQREAKPVHASTCEI